MTTIETTDIPPYKETFSLRKLVRANGTQLGILGVFIGLWIIFILAAPNTFTKPQIYYAFMSTIPFFAMMAMPLTILVIAGEMDLSFPSIMAIGMVVFLLTYFQFESIMLSFAAALLIGLFAGWLNGFIVVRFGIPSLVATIGTQFFWRGAVLVLSQNKNGSLAYAMGSPVYNILVGKLFGVIPMRKLSPLT